MIPFNCPHDPFSCGCSVFLESVDKVGNIKRWVECGDYYFPKDPETMRMGWLVKESHTVIVDGNEIVIKKGDLCINNPNDWWERYWEKYKEFKK